MSEMEEDNILEETGEELQNLEEKPKSFLVLVAVILGALSLVLSFISLKQGGSSGVKALEDRIAKLETPSIGDATKIDGAVGEEDIRSQLEEFKKELAELKTSPAGLNAGLSPGLGDELAKLKAEVARLKTQASNVRLPAAPGLPRVPAQAVTIPPGGTTYTVQAGDNFTKIANKFGVSVEKIIDANQGLDERRLGIGQKIVIPGTK